MRKTPIPPSQRSAQKSSSEKKNIRVLKFDPTSAGLVMHPLHKTHKALWGRLRKQLLKERGVVCEVCGHVGEERRHIHCHEEYSFPDNETVRLERVRLLCWRCHDAVHFERTRHRCGQPYIDEIAAHYRAVNGGISKKMFERDVQETFRQMLAIREAYGGPNASPGLDHGPFQAEVDRCLERQRERSATDDDEWDDHDPDEYYLSHWPYMLPEDDTSLGWWMFR